MKTHLKFAIAGFALLLSLGSSAQAASNPPQAAAPQATTQQVVIGPLAWQRVGAPISMEG